MAGLRESATQLGCFAVMITAFAACAMADWRHYGGGLEGTRFAASSRLTPANVDRLRLAWDFDVGSAPIKATPVLHDGVLYLSTGRNVVIALDAETGVLRWRYDPHVDFSRSYSENFTSRGVALWSGDGECPHRILMGTLDARLIALDADDGSVCFEKDLTRVRNFRRWDYSVTSPPTVVGDVVVVGSAVGDNGRTNSDSGVVRGFSARTGELIWAWDPIPRSENRPEVATWHDRTWRHTGGANVWSVMSADIDRGLVFLPTTAPAPDFYGGKRLGDNRHANSVVALRAATGEFVWAYQTVHHDLWDYDLAAQPALTNIGTRDVVVQAAKTGFVFVLDRDTGEQVFPVTERVVPTSDVQGERPSRTQPFPRLQLHPTKEAPEIWKRDPEHEAFCSKLLDGVRYDGIFTPPSVGGTLVFPGNPGGVNWGSMAVHESGVAFMVVTRMPTIVHQLPRREYERLEASQRYRGVEAQFTEQRGTPFGLMRYEALNPKTGMACHQGPYSKLVAVDLSAQQVIWEVAAGPEPWGRGANAAGPIVTKGGLVVLPIGELGLLHGYDMTTGDVVWTASVDKQAVGTPMAYHEFLVVAAGSRVFGFRLGGDAAPRGTR